jgi:hypothetical protein
LERRARDSKTGKNVLVPADMKYPEWKKMNHTKAIQGYKFKPSDLSSKNVSQHAADRVAEHGISLGMIDDALQNPLEVGIIKYDKKGRPSVRVIGEKAEVAYNPDTGIIASVNPTHSKKAQRLKERKNDD